MSCTLREAMEHQASNAGTKFWDLMRVSYNGGTPNSWMVFVREKPHPKWMI